MQGKFKKKKILVNHRKERSFHESSLRHNNTESMLLKTPRVSSLLFWKASSSAVPSCVSGLSEPHAFKLSLVQYTLNVIMHCELHSRR